MTVRRWVLVGAALLAIAHAAAAAGSPRPVLVELFTSQACSSCPPADALLGELARRPEVLALGYHVSYWNGAGWTDPLSSAAATERQLLYARRYAGGQVYTPQIVLDGGREMVGSDRGAVLAALAQVRPVSAAPVGFADDRHSVAIGAGEGTGEVLLVRFARHRTTRVSGGENAQRVLKDTNGVESLTPLGVWRGAAVRFLVQPPGADEGLAVLVQGRDGRMLGAAALDAGE